MVDFDVDFESNSLSKQVEFGETHRVSDGGYDRGYADGIKQGFADGYAAGNTDGRAEGYNKGHADGKAEGYEAGYAAGYEVGYAQGYTEGETAATAAAEAHNAAILTDCNAVLPTKGAETAETLEQVPQRIEEIKSYDEGYDVGVEDGKQAEYDRFWDGLQWGGQRTEYQYAFYNWDASAFPPKYDLIPTDASTMFGYFNKAYLDGEPVDFVELMGDKKLDLSKCTNVSTIFSYANVSHLPVLDFSALSTITNPLNWCNKLHTVDKIILKEDGSQTMGAPCNWCTELVEIRFEGKIGKTVTFVHSSKLSAESVQSIIDALKDLTGATAQTLTLHKTVGAKLTEAQKAAITAKNWTLVY